MRKILYSLLAGLLACYACQDNNSSLGSSLVESSFYNVFTNSCTVDLSTILLDSIETREDTIGHFGHYADTLWGEVTATYYAEFTKNTFSTTDGHDYQFDSLVLSMTPSGHYWGDTLTPQYISVYRLKQPIVLDNDEDLYNTTVMATEDVPLTRFSYLPQPGRQREVEVRLPDAMGQQLLTDILVEDTYLDTQESFKKVFPGLALVAETSGSCITGFLVNDSSMTLNLHYRDIFNQTTESELIFSVNTEYAYTGVRHNPTGTALDNLQSGIENLIHASSMGYRAYLQGLTGYYNQIEFPDLNELQSKGEIVSVESATLYLYPLARSYNEVSQLPEEEVEGMPSEYLYSTFEGTGGLYRCYVTNAFALTRHLSIGINLGMILGTVTQSETQENATVSYESSKRAFYTDFGLHYRFGGPNRNWEVGAVFAPSLKIGHDNRLTYSNSSTSEDMDKSYHSRTQYLPMHIGAGLTTSSEHWTVTMDYNYVDWSRNTSAYTSMKYENQHKLNVGTIYLTEPRKPRSTELMAGIGISNSYINLKGGKMYYLEGNIGVSFPVRYSFLSLGATWRQQVNLRDNLMQESRFSLNLNLTFGERIIRTKIK